jgi:hypothetical protein
MKKAANKAEKAHMDRVANLGCIICHNPYVVIHHITTARGFGGRSSHYEVLPLCVRHHDGGERGVAVHAGVKTWEAKFGTQKELLEKVRLLLSNN